MVQTGDYVGVMQTVLLKNNKSLPSLLNMPEDATGRCMASPPVPFCRRFANPQFRPVSRQQRRVSACAA